MSDDEYTGGVSVGNKVAEDGRAGVIIWFEPGRSKAALSPRGARLIARQLLEWADHAEAWEACPDDERKREWMTLREQPVETTFKAKIESTEGP